MGVVTFLAASIFLFLDLLFPAFYEERRDTFRRQWHKAHKKKEGLKGGSDRAVVGIRLGCEEGGFPRSGPI